MPTVRKEVLINAAPDAVWAAIADVGAIHERLCPGFVIATELEADGAARWVTFGSGLKVREVIVTLETERRRLVWTVESESVTHHNGAVEVFDDLAGGARAVWTADILPAAAVGIFDVMMDQGLAAMKACLER